MLGCQRMTVLKCLYWFCLVMLCAGLAAAVSAGAYDWYLSTNPAHNVSVIWLVLFILLAFVGAQHYSTARKLLCLHQGLKQLDERLAELEQQRP